MFINHGIRISEGVSGWIESVRPEHLDGAAG